MIILKYNKKYKGESTLGYISKNSEQIFSEHSVFVIVNSVFVIVNSVFVIVKSFKPLVHIGF